MFQFPLPYTTWCRLIAGACLERSLLNLFQQLIGLEGALMSQPHPPLQHGIKVSVLIVVHSAGYLRHFETAPPHPHRCEPHQLFSWSLHTCGANSESIGDRWSMTHFLGVFFFIIWINREKPSSLLMVLNMIDPTWLINHPISSSFHIAPHRISSIALRPLLRFTKHRCHWGFNEPQLVAAIAPCRWKVR